MTKHVIALGGASLLLGVSMFAMQTQAAEPTTPPDPPTFAAQGEPNFVGISDIFEYRALDSYNEPDFVKAFVDATPISGPASVGKTQSDSRAIVDSCTLTIAPIGIPSARQ